MVKWKRSVKIKMIKELIRVREYLTLVNFTYLSYILINQLRRLREKEKI